MIRHVLIPCMHSVVRSKSPSQMELKYRAHTSLSMGLAAVVVLFNVQKMFIL